MERIKYYIASTSNKGMTLVETLVAITILTVAIVSPMTLTMRSLSAAYYARDQVIAANLAQEAIEAVRAVRDGNILKIALNTTPTCASDGLPMHILCGIPVPGTFIVDAVPVVPTMTPCNPTPCAKMRTNDNLYGHDSAWPKETAFRRTVDATYVGAGQDEIRVTVTVTIESGPRAVPPVVIRENLYRWLSTGGP